MTEFEKILYRSLIAILHVVADAFPNMTVEEIISLMKAESK